MRKSTLALAAVAALSIAAPAGAGTTLVSENFESGTFGVLSPSGSINVRTGQDYANCCGATGNSASLANHVATFGVGIGSFYSPVLSTTAGQTYTLTFDYRAIGGGTVGDDLFVELYVDSVLFGGPSYLPLETLNLDTAFYHASIPFTPGADGTLRYLFRNGSGSGDLQVDNVVITTTADIAAGVPEPASWAMMLLGFTGIGLTMRLRRRLVTAQ